MRIGIFVHSLTGNTFSVAEKLRSKLEAGGHTTELRKLEPIGGENTNEIDLTKINFDPIPDVSGYDELVICAPVRAFSISPVLSAYLNKLPSMKAQKVDLFVTQQLSFSWLGGKHAISQMKSICEAKGAAVGKTGIINWGNKKRDIMIADLVDHFGTR